MTVNEVKFTYVAEEYKVEIKITKSKKTKKKKTETIKEPELTQTL